MGVNNANVAYEAFDFHAECSKMRWDRLSILMDRVAGVQEQQGFFLQEREGSFLMRQTGLFRTNCIDCLDRTKPIGSQQKICGHGPAGSFYPLLLFLLHS